MPSSEELRASLRDLRALEARLDASVHTAQAQYAGLARGLAEDAARELRMFAGVESLLESFVKASALPPAPPPPPQLTPLEEREPQHVHAVQPASARTSPEPSALLLLAQQHVDHGNSSLAIVETALTATTPVARVLELICSLHVAGVHFAAASRCVAAVRDISGSDYHGDADGAALPAHNAAAVPIAVLNGISDAVRKMELHRNTMRSISAVSAAESLRHVGWPPQSSETSTFGSAAAPSLKMVAPNSSASIASEESFEEQQHYSALSASTMALVLLQLCSVQSSALSSNSSGGGGGGEHGSRGANKTGPRGTATAAVPSSAPATGIAPTLWIVQIIAKPLLLRLKSFVSELRTQIAGSSQTGAKVRSAASAESDYIDWLSGEAASDPSMLTAFLFDAFSDPRGAIRASLRDGGPPPPSNNPSSSTNLLSSCSSSSSGTSSLAGAVRHGIGGALLYWEDMAAASSAVEQRTDAAMQVALQQHAPAHVMHHSDRVWGHTFAPGCSSASAAVSLCLSIGLQFSLEAAVMEQVHVEAARLLSTSFGTREPAEAASARSSTAVVAEGTESDGVGDSGENWGTTDHDSEWHVVTGSRKQQQQHHRYADTLNIHSAVSVPLRPPPLWGAAPSFLESDRARFRIVRHLFRHRTRRSASSLANGVTSFIPLPCLMLSHLFDEARAYDESIATLPTADALADAADAGASLLYTRDQHSSDSSGDDDAYAERVFLSRSVTRPRFPLSEFILALPAATAATPYSQSSSLSHYNSAANRDRPAALVESDAAHGSNVCALAAADCYAYSDKYTERASPAIRALLHPRHASAALRQQQQRLNLHCRSSSSSSGSLGADDAGAFFSDTSSLSPLLFRTAVDSFSSLLHSIHDRYALLLSPARRSPLSSSAASTVALCLVLDVAETVAGACVASTRSGSGSGSGSGSRSAGEADGDDGSDSGSTSSGDGDRDDAYPHGDADDDDAADSAAADEGYEGGRVSATPAAAAMAPLHSSTSATMRVPAAHAASSHSSAEMSMHAPYEAHAHSSGGHSSRALVKYTDNAEESTIAASATDASADERQPHRAAASASSVFGASTTGSGSIGGVGMRAFMRSIIRTVAPLPAATTSASLDISSSSTSVSAFPIVADAGGAHAPMHQAPILASAALLASPSLALDVDHVRVSHISSGGRGDGASAESSDHFRHARCPTAVEAAAVIRPAAARRPPPLDALSAQLKGRIRPVAAALAAGDVVDVLGASSPLVALSRACALLDEAWGAATAFEAAERPAPSARRTHIYTSALERTVAPVLPAASPPSSIIARGRSTFLSTLCDGIVGAWATVAQPWIRLSNVWHLREYWGEEATPAVAAEVACASFREANALLDVLVTACIVESKRLSDAATSNSSSSGSSNATAASVAFWCDELGEMLAHGIDGVMFRAVISRVLAHAELHSVSPRLQLRRMELHGRGKGSSSSTMEAAVTVGRVATAAAVAAHSLASGGFTRMASSMGRAAAAAAAATAASSAGAPGEADGEAGTGSRNSGVDGSSAPSATDDSSSAVAAAAGSGYAIGPTVVGRRVFRFLKSSASAAVSSARATAADVAGMNLHGNVSPGTTGRSSGSAAANPHSPSAMAASTSPGASLLLSDAAATTGGVAAGDDNEEAAEEALFGIEGRVPAGAAILLTDAPVLALELASVLAKLCGVAADAAPSDEGHNDETHTSTQQQQQHSSLGALPAFRSILRLTSDAVPAAKARGVCDAVVATLRHGPSLTAAATAPTNGVARGSGGDAWGRAREVFSSGTGVPLSSPLLSEWAFLGALRLLRHKGRLV